MVNGAYGRLRFKPIVADAINLYGGYSTFTYTFGSSNFDSNCICKITNTDYTASSDVISSCTTTGSSVIIKVGTDSSIA